MFLLLPSYNRACCLVQEGGPFQRHSSGCILELCDFLPVGQQNHVLTWSAPAYLWAFCPAVQFVRDGDICSYYKYKATVLAACHHGAQVQVATIWQDICSAVGRAVDAATCPQRRHCPLPLGKALCSAHVRDRSETNPKDGLSSTAVTLQVWGPWRHV